MDEFTIRKINELFYENVRLGNLEMVKYLFSIGAYVCYNNNISIREEAEYGHLEIVDFLIDNGADIHI